MRALTTTGNDTIPQTLLHHAERTPDAPWLVFEDDAGRTAQRTYGQALRTAARVANLLRRTGAGGGTVHMHLPNSPEFYDCWFGAALAGAQIVPTNPLSTADELSYVLQHADCRLTITQGDLYETVRTAAALRGGHPVLVARTRQEPAGATLLDDALADVPDELEQHLDWQATDVVGVLYTSGTTSRPKGVLVTSAAYLHVGEVVAQHVRLRPDDRQLIVLPLFHGNAQYYSTMSALVTGASVALTERFSASRWSDQAARLGATYGSLFAAPIRMILTQPPGPSDQAHGLRGVLFAQNVTEEQLATFEERFGCPLLQLYGMTETVAPPTINPAYGQRRNMSIGRPVLPARVRIVDDQGSDVPTGEVGQLLTYGEPGLTMMAGYLHDPEATAEAVRDGWLHTGDNVRADADGYLHFVDRGKDMVKRAGENVATGEVERVLNEHPDVYESAVIGVPDPVRDEAIKAFVVPDEGAQPDADELIAWCAQRLAKFKVPSFIELVGSLPRTSVGKIQKHLLRRLEQAAPDDVTDGR